MDIGPAAAIWIYIVRGGRDGVTKPVSERGKVLNVNPSATVPITRQHEESVDGIRFKEFILSLKKRLGSDKILLICDNASFHKSQALEEWYLAQKSWLCLEFLPPYSPDFNPIERLWKWFKGEFTHNRCWKTNGLLMRDLQKALHRLNDGQ